jgi:hypothetical protein
VRGPDELDRVFAVLQQPLAEPVLTALHHLNRVRQVWTRPDGGLRFSVLKYGIGRRSSGGCRRKKYPNGVRVSLAYRSSCFRDGRASSASHASSLGNRLRNSSTRLPARSRAQRRRSGLTATRLISFENSVPDGDREPIDRNRRQLLGYSVPSPSVASPAHKPESPETRTSCRS